MANWTAALNATVCAFAGDAIKDRMVFTPAEWPALSYVPLLEGTITALVTVALLQANRTVLLEQAPIASVKFSQRPGPLPANVPIIVATIIGVSVAAVSGICALVTNSTAATAVTGFAATPAAVPMGRPGKETEKGSKKRE